MTAAKPEIAARTRRRQALYWAEVGLWWCVCLGVFLPVSCISKLSDWIDDLWKQRLFTIRDQLQAAPPKGGTPNP